MPAHTLPAVAGKLAFIGERITLQPAFDFFFRRGNQRFRAGRKMDFHKRAADEAEHLRFEPLLHEAQPGELAMGGNPVIPCGESSVDIPAPCRLLLCSQPEQKLFGHRQKVSMDDRGHNSAILRISHDPSSR
jgi:hypothetical protein